MPEPRPAPKQKRSRRPQLSRRRCHSWSLPETFELGCSELPKDDQLPVDAGKLVRAAGRCWGLKHGHVLGDFRTLRLVVQGATRTAAQCFKHEECNTFYEFTGQWSSINCFKSVSSLTLAGEEEKPGRQAPVGP